MNAFEQEFTALIQGHLTDVEAESFLWDTAARKISANDLLIACRSLGAMATPLRVPADAIDVCGTGGDARGTLNISTAVALVVAALGVPVAKHGNRAATSHSGATDVLEALGIATNLSPDAAAQQLAQHNITFLAAPLYHPALVRLAPLRRKIGQRTIFNLLGPLLNPGQVKLQLIGVYAPEWALPMAEALRDLGSKRAWVVNGDGLDEITITGPTHVASLNDGVIESFSLDPRDYGIVLSSLSAIQGGTPAENAAALIRLFEGEAGPYRDIVCLNAAAALLIAGRTENLAKGIDLSRQALETGAALTLLRTLQHDSAV